MNILEILLQEKRDRTKGGIYHHTQIKLSFNTNRIEGSQLSEEQTRYIYETNTIITENADGTVNVDDIIETVNHFSCFDFMLDIAGDKLSEQQIKEFHRILKSNTSDARKSWFNIGGYKTRANMVGGLETCLPEKVQSEMSRLINYYNQKLQITIEDIIDFHFRFEKIHPFQDGNGRVGRLVMFKECLKNNIVPFIIEDKYKFFYYRGLSEYLKTNGHLLDTCLSAQDKYKAVLDYFSIKY